MYQGNFPVFFLPFHELTVIFPHENSLPDANFDLRLPIWTNRPPFLLTIIRLDHQWLPVWTTIACLASLPAGSVYSRRVLGISFFIFTFSSTKIFFFFRFLLWCNSPHCHDHRCFYVIQRRLGLKKLLDFNTAIFLHRPTVACVWHSNLAHSYLYLIRCDRSPNCPSMCTECDQTLWLNIEHMGIPSTS